MRSPSSAVLPSATTASRRWAAAALLVACLTRVDAQVPLPQLTAGATIEQPTQATRTHTYLVDLRADDIVDVEFAQDQVSVTATLVDPDGRVVQTADLPESEPLPLLLAARAATSGSYRLQVVVNDRGNEIGQDRMLTLRVGTLGPATPEAIERARLADLMSRAGALVMRQRLADLQQSIPLYLEAADGWRTLGESAFEASTLQSLAAVTGLFSQFRATSATARERLLPLLRELQLTEEEADAWYSLGHEYFDDGQVARARDAALEGMAVSSTLTDRERYGRDLQFASYFEAQLGNYEEARQLAGQAIDVAIAIDNNEIEAMGLTTLASLQALSGDIHAAIEQQTRAATLARGTRRHRDLLNRLGMLQLSAGDVDRAGAAFEDALRIEARHVQREQESLTRIGLGDVARQRDDRPLARQRYQEALTILQASGYQLYRCRLEGRLGQLDLADGDVAGAAARFTEALAISRDLADASCESYARGGLADIALAERRLDDAQAHALRLVQLSDEFREASGSIEARTIGFAQLAPTYERAVDLTMRLADGDVTDRHTGDALALNERALARGLLDALTREQVERRAAVPQPLAQERRRLRETWRARAIEHETALQKRATSRAAALSNEISVLATQLRDVEARIDAGNARQAAFTRPKPLEVGDIQRLLDEDTQLVEYGLAETRTYVWVVDRTRILARELAARADVDAAVRRARAVIGRVPSGTNQAALDAARSASLAELARLLVAPIAKDLTARRIVVVAPAALAQVPFAALPAADAQPLLVRHEVVMLPSMTVLAALRTKDATGATPTRSVAIFADPVYERDDPRLTARRTAAAPPSTLRSSEPAASPVSPRGWTSSSGGPALTRLPFSSREATAIQRYARSASLRLVGLDATRERALAGELSDYRIIHFAAHGLQQPEVPNLSGLALSLVDATGRARNGFLMLPDIYDLRLNADLVVLSACETALGTEVRGEGILGLPRGFMYAGAARVISSLWRVDDEATAALMEGFYRRVLRDRTPPAAALRAAQLELRRTTRWRSPYFWAGFALQGDWR